MMGTFTKSFGAAGGYIGASKKVIDHLRSFSAGCCDAVTMPPACTIQIIQALKMLTGEDGTDIGAKKLRQLRENAIFFRDELKKLGLEVLGQAPSPVMPVMLYSPVRIPTFSRKAFTRGLAVVVVAAPATPPLLSRVRFCLSAAHSREDLVDALQKIDEIAEELKIKFNKYPSAKYNPFISNKGTIHELEQYSLPEKEKMVKRVNDARADAIKAYKACTWKPLVPDLTAQEEEYRHVPIPIEYGPLTIALSCNDYLGFRNNADLAETCANVVQRLGCGSCSPRGFYGTFMEHLQLESDLKQFLGVGEAVLYPFGACTVSSVVQAMVEPDTIAVVDEGVSRGIRLGLRLAKCKVVFYKHCDAADAARQLAKLESEDGDSSLSLKAHRKRRFLITEAIFANTGKMCPLPELCQLRKQYKCRIILEESQSFGVLGGAGRGITEHFSIPIESIDCIAASLEGAGSSVGGFAVGATGVIAYQRLLGAGYVFSASLPPYLAAATSFVLRELSEDSGVAKADKLGMEKLSRVRRCQRAARYLNRHLRQIPGLVTHASPLSPVVPLILANPSGNTDKDACTLRKIAKACQARNLVVTVNAPQAMLQKEPPAPHLKVVASAGFDDDTLQKCVVILREEAIRVLNPSLPLQGHAESQVPLPSMVDLAEPSNFAVVNAPVDDGKPAAMSHQQFQQNRATNQQLTQSAQQNQVIERERQRSRSMSAPPHISSEVEQLPSMSMPGLVIIMWFHTILRKYLIGQIYSNALDRPALLAMIGVSGETETCFGLFLKAVNVAASRQAYFFYGPILVWLYDNHYIQVLVVSYCLLVGVGCTLKSAIATQPMLSRPTVESGGESFVPVQHVESWPSVAAITATAIPFFMLRWRYGQKWVWENDNVAQCFFEYFLAVVFLVLVCVARVTAGDNPANVQGGMVVGAIAARVVTPYADTMVIWLSTVERYAFPTFWPALGLAALMAFAFPMPVNADGTLLPIAKVNYRRTLTILLFMISFLWGSVCRDVPDVSPVHELSTKWVAVRLMVGGALTFVLSKVAVWGSTNAVEKTVNILYKQDGKVPAAIRANCLVALELFKAVAYGFIVALLVPIAFGIIGV
jgi:serine palmitoyltransferase